MPLSTIFQLYRGSQFYWWGKPTCKYPEKTTHHLTVARISFDGSGDLSLIVGNNITDASHDLIISVGNNIMYLFIVH
jgi:hypothetical protein